MTPDVDLPARLIEDAAAHRLIGWDWSWMRSRWSGASTPWDYRDIASLAAANSTGLLDLDTGGGEVLAKLPSLPRRAVATEAHPPNIAIARGTLAPRGVPVVAAHPSRLPFRDKTFDLILNRHGAFEADELHRLLAPGGRFITQQVGPSNFQELNEFLAGRPVALAGPSLEEATEALSSAGLEIDEVHHAYIPAAFYDVGAIAFYLFGVPWQIPGFDPRVEHAKMTAAHKHITTSGAFHVTAERYLIQAHRA